MTDSGLLVSGGQNRCDPIEHDVSDFREQDRFTVAVTSISESSGLDMPDEDKRGCVDLQLPIL